MTRRSAGRKGGLRSGAVHTQSTAHQGYTTMKGPFQQMISGKVHPQAKAQLDLSITPHTNQLKGVKDQDKTQDLKSSLKETKEKLLNAGLVTEFMDLKSKAQIREKKASGVR